MAAQTENPAKHVGADDIYSRIRRRIIEGHVTPGLTLGEAQLSTEYGVSRTPVRNALARLEQDGLLERVRFGYAVPVRSPEQVVELFEARIILDLAAAELAAQRRSEVDLARLRHLLEQAEAATGADLIHINDAFHGALREAAHNPTVAQLASRVDAQLAAYEAQPAGAPDDRQTTQDEHRRVFDAVHDRDPARARSELQVHVHRARDLRIAALAREDRRI
ncbi:GntR family transcriptional regulator [Dactylosporangium sp. NPDC051485]|uniref:GntR family transcriptional regulator n=1 Tax=Dactylosporangium sp. NPDC051485 TaxID=3154846 RepID=UPI00341501C5